MSKECENWWDKKEIMKISKYINFQQIGALLKKDFLVRIRQPVSIFLFVGALFDEWLEYFPSCY